MLTKRYMTSVKNLPAIMHKIVEGTAPGKFTVAHLQGLGFKSSNDLGVIPLLKDLGFLTADGTPTKRYHEYRDASRSRAVMAQALREAYEDLFHINAKPAKSDEKSIFGKFKSAHNVTDTVAEEPRTFFGLLKLADLDATAGQPPAESLSDSRPTTMPRLINPWYTRKKRSTRKRTKKCSRVSGVSDIRLRSICHPPAT